MLHTLLGKDGFRPFTETDSVFGRPVVSGFNRALRKVRIMIAEELASKVAQPEELLR